MKTFKEHLEEENSAYLATFKVDGKVQKQMNFKDENSLKQQLHKLWSHFRGADSADLNVMDILDKVNKGKPQVVKMGGKELVIQKNKG